MVFQELLFKYSPAGFVCPFPGEARCHGRQNSNYGLCKRFFRPMTREKWPPFTLNSPVTSIGSQLGSPKIPFAPPRLWKYEISPPLFVRVLACFPLLPLRTPLTKKEKEKSSCKRNEVKTASGNEGSSRFTTAPFFHESSKTNRRCFN